MATFADMMTLLFCFFVLLLSFATMDATKFQAALGSIQEALGVDVERVGPFQAAATSPIPINLFETQPDVRVEDRDLLDELTQAIEMEGLQHDIDAELNGRGVLVRVGGRLLYEAGDATLKEQAYSLLDRLAQLASRSDHHIMIEGHTDDVPIHTSQFPSNWELSTARAIAAMRYLVAYGIALDRIGVAGYGGQRPLEPNDSADHRAANRRVEFVFIRQDAES